MTTVAERLERSRVLGIRARWRQFFAKAATTAAGPDEATVEHVYRSGHVEDGQETTALGRYVAPDLLPVRPDVGETTRVIPPAVRETTPIFDTIAAGFGLAAPAGERDTAGDSVLLPTLDQLRIVARRPNAGGAEGGDLHA